VSAVEGENEAMHPKSLVLAFNMLCLRFPLWHDLYFSIPLS